MLNNEFSFIAKKVAKLKPRNYWLIRTNGGQNYNYFKQNNVVGIGWSKILLQDIKNLKFGEVGELAIVKKVQKEYPEERNPKSAINQLKRFIFDIKRGDIVIIPDYNSFILSIGEITDDITIERSNIHINDKRTDINKFRKVEWKTTILKELMEAELYKMLFAHRAVSLITKYEFFIDRILNTFYFKNGNFHLVMDIQEKKDIVGMDFFKTWVEVFELIEEFGKENKIEVVPSKLRTKFKVQSPGIIEFITENFQTIVILASVTFLLVGGDFAIKLKEREARFKTDGLINRIDKFLNNRANRNICNIIAKKMENGLKLKDSEDFIKILKEIPKDNHE